MKKIAIIGTGLSGLTLGHQLKNHANITLFDKSRGVGGRMATRYAGDFEFDHGAQFFIAKTKAFQDFLSPLIQHKIIQRWDAHFTEINREGRRPLTQWTAKHPHFVGTPRMNAIGKYLVEPLNIKLNTKITTLTKTKNLWTLRDDKGMSFHDFDLVLITSPLPQTQELLAPLTHNFTFDPYTSMMGCYSLMLGFKSQIDLGFETALVKEHDISWISVNSSKPERKDNFTLLIHSTNKWADSHSDMPTNQVKEHLLRETELALGNKLPSPGHTDLHLWRYANTATQNAPTYQFDFKTGLGLCGDWCIKGRIESAFLSAHALSSHIKDTLLS